MLFNFGEKNDITHYEVFPNGVRYIQVVSVCENK